MARCHATPLHRLARLPRRHPAPGPGRCAPGSRAQPLPRLKVSDNKRFLVTADGKPFFYLGDTAWELFHRLNREEAERYLKNRARAGSRSSRRSCSPSWTASTSRTPTATCRLTTTTRRSPNEAYFAHVDCDRRPRQRARPLRRHAADVGRQVEHAKRAPARRSSRRTTPSAYGEWLGRRYKDAGIIWILGGDRPIENDDAPRRSSRAMARGLRKGDGGAHLITFHPARRPRLVDVVPRRRLARLQHAAERPRRRVHRPLRPDTRRLRPHADEAGARRRADLRGPPGLVQRQEARPLDRGRRAPAALLGSVHRRLRAHLRAPLGLADVGARAASRSTIR